MENLHEICGTYQSGDYEHEKFENPNCLISSRVKVTVLADRDFGDQQLYEFYFGSTKLGVR